MLRLEVVAELEDEISGGRDLDKSPKGTLALGMVRVGAAEALVVAKLDRVPRSVPAFGRFLEDVKHRGWDVVILDPKIDTTSANGELVPNILISVALRERRIIGERIRAAHRVVRVHPREDKQAIAGPPGARRNLRADRARVCRRQFGACHRSLPHRRWRPHRRE